uniref:FUN14 domain containing 1 n=1 Tax=Lynx canadensis TaxID=61383 RepID=A0A667H076_LYNCA
MAPAGQIHLDWRCHGDPGTAPSTEGLDLTEYARRHHWWNRVFGHSSGPVVEKYSVATQIVRGGVTGWHAGATALGGGFALLIIEEATEFIKQNMLISSGFVGSFLLGLAS